MSKERNHQGAGESAMVIRLKRAGSRGELRRAIYAEMQGQGPYDDGLQLLGIVAAQAVNAWLGSTGEDRKQLAAEIGVDADTIKRYLNPATQIVEPPLP